MSKLLRRTATNSRALLAVLVIVSGVNESSAAQGISPDQYDALYYRHIGPVGNRIASVAGIPGDPMTYYVGAASGGIWKTVDGGVFWAPIFDGYPVQAIGPLSVSELDSEIVWAGTGESHIRSNVTIGNGVWKSTDGGANWHHMGLDATGRISRIVIHPTNPDVVYVASLGHGHAPQPERGIYRTTDGGESWEHVLFVDEHTGASSLEMDPNNPRILYAGMWQILTLIAKKREQSSAKVLTKEPLGLCLERCFQTKHQTTRGPYSALETISISPELQQGSSDRVHRAEPELVWWTGTVFTIFAPR